MRRQAQQQQQQPMPKLFSFNTGFIFSIERETGIEPATPSLARRCSTTEPLAHISLHPVVLRLPQCKE
jgi:hypothetical protein